MVRVGARLEVSSLLTEEDRALLRRVVELLESLLETLDILLDRDTMKALEEAEEDLASGRVRDFDEFVRELRETGGL